MLNFREVLKRYQAHTGGAANDSTHDQWCRIRRWFNQSENSLRVLKTSGQVYLVEQKVMGILGCPPQEVRP